MWHSNTLDKKNSEKKIDWTPIIFFCTSHIKKIWEDISKNNYINAYTILIKVYLSISYKVILCNII